MSHPYYHAKSSARKFGGIWEDYVELHEWFDQTKAHHADTRHRAILHNTFGIYLLQQVFGEVITRKSDGVVIPTRPIGEQHVLEDLGFIPNVSHWLNCMKGEPWMNKASPLSKMLKEYEEINGTEGNDNIDGKVVHQIKSDPSP